MNKIRKAAATLMLMSSANAVGIRGLFGCCHRARAETQWDRDFRQLEERVEKYSKELEEFLKDPYAPMFYSENILIGNNEVCLKSNKKYTFVIHKQRVIMLPKIFYIPCCTADQEFTREQSFSAYYMKNLYTTTVTVTNPSQGNGPRPLEILINAQRRVFSENGEERDGGCLILNCVDGQLVGMDGPQAIYDEMARRFTVLVRGGPDGEEWIASAATGFVLRKR